MLTAPTAHVVRDGRTCELPVAEVVVDGGLEVDESLLTGESVPVDKHRGVPLYSGSVVVAGDATMQVGQVGDQAFESNASTASTASTAVRPP